ncbi:MAG: 2-hydroxyacyl-CoA dehydratase [Deltaproteobacteria bacterium]|nr:2-hydroxyacyl-CoA dehydratase [Deltaproteobacteria bacterium]
MSDNQENIIGFSSTIPVEILLAAGRRPCDLNNLFITDPGSLQLVAAAEEAGFPATSCAWIKGIYAAVHRHRLRRVIAVVTGDCSSTHALAEVLAHDGIEVIPFGFPLDRQPAAMSAALEQLAARLGVSLAAAEEERRQLLPVRRQLAELDRLTWEENLVSGEENHRWLVAASDFNGDPERFAAELDDFLALAAARPPRPAAVRLGIIGVPTICGNLYQELENLGAAVVFNEVQRQFSMPGPADRDLCRQYLDYTYPYPVAGRVADIRREAARRRLDGLIHYVQSFCFRQIEDIIVKRELDLPVLTLEADRPGPVDGRTLTRLETFVEMLRARRSRRPNVNKSAPAVRLSDGGRRDGSQPF